MMIGSHRSTVKQLRREGAELWTVQAKAAVTDVELWLRSILSHEIIERQHCSGPYDLILSLMASSDALTD